MPPQLQSPEIQAFATGFGGQPVVGTHVVAAGCEPLQVLLGAHRVHGLAGAGRRR
mgnify:CR=1 FL=1